MSSKRSVTGCSWYSSSMRTCQNKRQFAYVSRYTAVPTGRVFGDSDSSDDSDSSESSDDSDSSESREDSEDSEDSDDSDDSEDED